MVQDSSDIQNTGSCHSFSFHTLRTAPTPPVDVGGRVGVGKPGLAVVGKSVRVKTVFCCFSEFANNGILPLELFLCRPQIMNTDPDARPSPAADPASAVPFS